MTILKDNGRRVNEGNTTIGIIENIIRFILFFNYVTLFNQQMKRGAYEEVTF